MRDSIVGIRVQRQALGADSVISYSVISRFSCPANPICNLINLRQFTTSDFGPSFSGRGRFPRESMAETKALVRMECADEGDAAVYECVAENEAERASIATRVGQPC